MNVPFVEKIHGLFIHNNTWNKEGNWDNPKNMKIIPSESRTINKKAFEKHIYMKEPIQKIEESIWITWKKAYEEEEEW